MKRLGCAVLALSVLSPAPLLAQDMATTMTAAMPVYSRILAFPVPTDFEPAFDNENDGSFIMEFVPSGETVEDWSQMITVTGAQGAAAAGDPLDYGTTIGQGFQAACPDSFRAWDEGVIEVKGAESAQLFAFACGDVGGYSERAVILVAFGAEDVYTLQWAARGDAVAQPEADTEVWQPRAQNLIGLRLCEVIEGEAAPYPSCTN